MINTLVRLPDRIHMRAVEEASSMGLSIEELILLAVQEYVDDPLDGRVRLLAEIAAFIDRTYSPESFPPDVMLRVFHHIRRNPDLHAVYRADDRRALVVALLTALARRPARTVPPDERVVSSGSGRS